MSEFRRKVMAHGIEYVTLEAAEDAHEQYEIERQVTEFEQRMRNAMALGTESIRAGGDDRMDSLAMFEMFEATRALTRGRD